MSEQNSCLEPRSIAELKGVRFRIPSYQRGYRWERLQVEQLLDDIAESDENFPYYLQPVVVAPASNDVLDKLKNEEKFDYDLIDGQQRLTTILLILKALNKFKTPPSGEEWKKYMEGGRMSELQALMSISGVVRDSDVSVDYDILFETRKDSAPFLKDISTIGISDKRINASPDHLYMWRSFQSICRWFRNQSNNIVKIQKVANAIKSRVRIIWYVLPETVTDWKKFTDLNIGKIPLTNSELVKALFLRSSNFSNDKASEEYDKQTFVAQWDQIERELSDVDFWGFLTTESPQSYPTKIDLFLDLTSNKPLTQSKDPLYTFNYYVEWFKNNPNVTGQDRWNEIFLQYQRLRDWYADRNIYHRLGYLISINYPLNTLARIFRFAHPERKEARSTERINNMLNCLVKKSLRIPAAGKFEDVNSFRDLRYNCSDDPDNKVDTTHHYMIKRFLTLYNLMVTESAGQSLRYSFAHHNTIGGGWSLEHIHAQKSETLNKRWQWSQWVKTHLESLTRMKKSNDLKQYLATRMMAVKDKMDAFEQIGTRPAFDEITSEFREIMEALPGASGLYQDEMANMALLGKYDNSTLNNSTFDVKRQKIIRMLSTNYVPIATERVFLKAIVSDENASTNYACDTDHLYFWGDTDRKAYMADMECKLKEYITI